MCGPYSGNSYRYIPESDLTPLIEGMIDAEERDGEDVNPGLGDDAGE